MQVDGKYCDFCPFNRETIFENLQKEPQRSHPSSRINRCAYNRNFVRFISSKDFGKEAQTEADTLANRTAENVEYFTQILITWWAC